MTARGGAAIAAVVVIAAVVAGAPVGLAGAAGQADTARGAGTAGLPVRATEADGAAGRATEALPVPSASHRGWWSVVGLLVVGLGVWRVRRQARGLGPVARLNLVAQLPLGGRTRAVWLRCGTRQLVVAVSPQSVQVLDRWQDGASREEERDLASDLRAAATDGVFDAGEADADADAAGARARLTSLRSAGARQQARRVPCRRSSRRPEGAP